MELELELKFELAGYYNVTCELLHFVRGHRGVCCCGGLECCVARVVLGVTARAVVPKAAPAVIVVRCA